MIALATVIGFGLLMGCANDANHPLAPGEDTQDYLSEINIMTRTPSAPGLAGDGPEEVTFLVTPDEGGSGVIGFVTFDVSAHMVREKMMITVSIDDDGLYTFSLNSTDGKKLRNGYLRIHVESEDLGESDGDDIVVYRETHRGWRQVYSWFDPDQNDVIIIINKMSRYALSRE